MPYRRPNPGSRIAKMYDPTAIRVLETDPKALGLIPTVSEAIELARDDLKKERRALSFQYLAVTDRADLVLLQVGREEFRAIWNFGKLDLPTPEKLLVAPAGSLPAYDDPNQG